MLTADSKIGGTLTNHATLKVPTGLRLTTKHYADTSTGSLSGDGTLKTEKITR